MIVSEALSHAVVVSGLAQAVARDTVVALPPGGWHTWVDALSGIAQVVIAIAMIVIGVFTVAIFALLWKLYRRLNAAAEKLRIDLEPAVRNAVAASESARGMVATVQGNVAEVSRTVSAANERIGRVVDSAERRAADLNALLDVAQEEAEALFIRTASTLRGVRAGAGEFRRTRRVRPAGYHGDDPMDHEISDDELEIRIVAREAGQSPRSR